MNSYFSVVLKDHARMALAVAVLASVALVSGCAKPSASANVYTYGQAQRDQVVRNGTIVNIRPITIQNDHTSGAGAVAGGAVGGVMGNAIGGGNGRTLAVLGGAILGALAGDTIEDKVGKKDGFEITVRLDNGETRVIAQEADVPLVLNQRVQVVSGAGPTRVTPVSGQ